MQTYRGRLCYSSQRVLDRPLNDLQALNVVQIIDPRAGTCSKDADSNGGARVQVPRPGRRERHHQERRQQYLHTAMAIVADHGVERLTMQRMADDLDCAVGTIYTYFDSKDALLAELQRLATHRIIGSYRLLVARIETDLVAQDLDPADAALTRLLLGMRFWVATAEIYPDESQLFRSLFTWRSRMAQDQAAQALPSAWELFALASASVQDAIDTAAISPGNAGQRLVTAVAALGGVLLLSGLSSHDPDLFAGPSLAHTLIGDLLRGWGADAHRLAAAGELADRLTSHDPLVPFVPGIEAV